MSLISLCSFMYYFYRFLRYIVSYPFTNFFINQMIKNTPVKSPKYLPQQLKVQIPFPQHSPIIAIKNTGRIMMRKKFLI